MRKDGDKPNCCEKGNEYILWHVKCIDASGDEFTSWGMCVGYFVEDLEYEKIEYCPFCGKKLDRLDWIREIMEAK